MVSHLESEVVPSGSHVRIFTTLVFCVCRPEQNEAKVQSFKEKREQ